MRPTLGFGVLHDRALPPTSVPDLPLSDLATLGNLVLCHSCVLSGLLISLASEALPHTHCFWDLLGVKCLTQAPQALCFLFCFTYHTK